VIKYIFSIEKHFYPVQASMKRINKMLFGHCTVATSPVTLHWLCDSPRTGCARRKALYMCGANKQ